MSIDFGALTEAVVAGLPDVRSCLMVSRDGLALGASPAAEEGRTLEVWTRIAALGDVERGFATVQDEVWVFCRRGAYGAVATASSTARPGVILDSLEQMVLMAEEARVRKDAFRQATDREAPSADQSRGLRTPLHRDRGAADVTPEQVVSVDAKEVGSSGWPKRLGGGREADLPAPGAGPASAHPAPEPQTSDPGQPSPPEAPAAVAEVRTDPDRRERTGDDSGVDRVELSREFAAILAEHEEEEG
jgi:hypothetical protein